MTTAAAFGPRYARVLAASTVSGLGDGVRVVAAPLLAASITRSPLVVSLVAVAASLPWLLCSLFSGVLVDRLDARRVIWVASLFQAVVASGFAVSVLAGARRVPWLIAVVLVIGAAQTLVDLAAQAIVPQLVHHDQLDVANGRLQAGIRVSGQLAGPALGGVLFAWWDWTPFLFDAASFGLASALMLGLPGTYRPEEQAPDGWRVLARLGEGLRWLAAHRPLRTLCGVLAIWAVADTAIAALLPLYALQVLRLDESLVGVLLAASAVGGIAGSLAAHRLTVRFGRLRVIYLALCAVATAYLGMFFPSTALAAVMLALLGAASGVWVVVATSYRQQLIPRRLLGRVSSAYRFVGFGARPFGALLGGLVADAFGLRAPFLIGALVVLAATAFAMIVLRAE